jgi:hypothetical protein
MRKYCRYFKYAFENDVELSLNNNNNNNNNNKLENVPRLHLREANWLTAKFSD